MGTPERKVRPAKRFEAQPGDVSGRHNSKRNMEASENTGRPAQGSASGRLHRIDPDRVTQTLGSDPHAAGFSRLELMLTAVLPRLVDGTRPQKAD
jgi:hypothetical protein